MIQNRDLFYIGLRSFLLQAVWNFERMQNVGFVFILKPLLKKFTNDKEGYFNALKRHLEFFNVQPYMVSIIAGLVVAYEERMKIEGVDFTKEIRTLKSTMAGPLSAIGDSFFWGTWRPFSALIIILLFYLTQYRHFILGAYYSNEYYFLILLLFIVCYNIPHLYMRFWGVFKAYHIGTKVITYVRRWHDFKVYTRIHLLALILLAAGFFVFMIVQNFNISTIFALVGLEIVFIIANYYKVSVVKLIYITTVIVFLLVLLRIIA
ncbi:MAG: PTS system mannose/fructose/sorbose family transporter subunit IID [Elusimicrobiota bacterium]